MKNTWKGKQSLAAHTFNRSHGNLCVLSRLIDGLEWIESVIAEWLKAQWVPYLDKKYIPLLAKDQQMTDEVNIEVSFDMNFFPVKFNSNPRPVMATVDIYYL